MLADLAGGDAVDENRPDPRRSLRRPTILAMMLLVGLVAIGMAAWRYKLETNARSVKLALIKSDLIRAEDRLEWATKMRDKGYISPAQVLADKLNLDKARWALKRFEDR